MQTSLVASYQQKQQYYRYDGTGALVAHQCALDDRLALTRQNNDDEPSREAPGPLAMANKSGERHEREEPTQDGALSLQTNNLEGQQLKADEQQPEVVHHHQAIEPPATKTNIDEDNHDNEMYAQLPYPAHSDIEGAQYHCPSGMLVQHQTYNHQLAVAEGTVQPYLMQDSLQHQHHFDAASYYSCEGANAMVQASTTHQLAEQQLYTQMAVDIIASQEESSASTTSTSEQMRPYSGELTIQPSAAAMTTTSVQAVDLTSSNHHQQEAAPVYQEASADAAVYYDLSSSCVSQQQHDVVGNYQQEQQRNHHQLYYQHSYQQQASNEFVVPSGSILTEQNRFVQHSNMTSGSASNEHYDDPVCSFRQPNDYFDGGQQVATAAYQNFLYAADKQHEPALDQNYYPHREPTGMQNNENHNYQSACYLMEPLSQTTSQQDEVQNQQHQQQSAHFERCSSSSLRPRNSNSSFVSESDSDSSSSSSSSSSSESTRGRRDDASRHMRDDAGSTSAGTDLDSLDWSPTRDEKKAREANIQLSYYEIVNLPIDQFNEHITRVAYSEAQLNLMKDIRRRGKNKVAAQMCRKRKMEQIQEVQVEVGALMSRRLQLFYELEILRQHHEKLNAEYSRLHSLIQGRLRADRSPLATEEAQPQDTKESEHEDEEKYHHKRHFTETPQLSGARIAKEL